ncbi:MAG: DUF92 domain-containing protein, partial [Panacibacter sp.]
AANTGIAAILGILIYFYPSEKNILSLMMAATFASATADTLSSELGNICGSKFYNIITLQKDGRGLNGVISLEGILIGLGGSVIIAIIYAFGFGWSAANILLITLAGAAGNIGDSIIGATAERKLLLKNNAVNFLSTGIAAITALLLHMLYR